MSTWLLRFAGITAIAGAVAFTASAASATPAAPARAPAAAALAAPPTFQPDFEAQYVPITPCRIVDTRGGTGTNGTPFSSLQTRTYYVGGTFGFAPQGGTSGGCGIPMGAVSISAVLTAVTPSHAGFFRAWPSGLPEPGATVLNYSTVNVGTGVTLAINASSATALTVRNHGGPSDLVVDAFGYYVKPLAGLISPLGDRLAGSSRIINATRTATGAYEVQFDRNIQYCAATATAFSYPYYPSVDALSNAPDTVQVRVWNPDGTLVAVGFYIHVSC